MTQVFVSDQFCYSIPVSVKKWTVCTGIGGRHAPESVDGLRRNWWTISPGLCSNIMRNLNSALEFFDNPDAKSLDYQDILSFGKMSIINVAGEKGIQFGSILLRHLLKRIIKAKSEQRSEVPILIIIDEVHQFYNTESSREALGELDTICRTGRSQKIGVIFSSQNPNDLPRGLSSVINSKIYFRSDGISGSYFEISNSEIQSLKPGYALVNIHNIPQLKIIKFPLSFSGVSLGGKYE